MKKIAVITPISHLKGLVDLLQSKGEVILCERGTKDEVRQLLLNCSADTLLCNPNLQTFVIDKDLLEGTSISTINTCSTGTNHIDMQYCSDRQIEVLSLKRDFELIDNLPSTAELSFGLMLSLLRSIPHANSHVAQYCWDYTLFIGRQVKDLNIGIIGCGRLGKMMKSYCESFGANTFVYDPYVDSKQTSLQQMFTTCDVISLHVHITPETRHIVNCDLLGLSKKDLYIVNTSRGEVVNEQHIVDALKNGNLTGYATDVVEHEFGDITKSPIIRGLAEGLNIIVTPHIGGMTQEGQNKAYKWSISKL